jgi:hypothetical protein
MDLQLSRILREIFHRKELQDDALEATELTESHEEVVKHMNKRLHGHLDSTGIKKIPEYWTGGWMTTKGELCNKESLRWLSVDCGGRLHRCNTRQHHGTFNNGCSRAWQFYAAGLGKVLKEVFYQDQRIFN